MTSPVGRSAACMTGTPERPTSSNLPANAVHSNVAVMAMRFVTIMIIDQNECVDNAVCDMLE